MFATLTTLRPNKPYDHSIPLKFNALPFSQRPYRYPYIQKNQVEILIKEILEEEIIQPCDSSFVSPMLVVKKRRYIVLLYGLQNII